MSEVYYNKEIRDLRQFVFLDLEDGPPDGILKMLGVDSNRHHEELRELFIQKVGEAVDAAQGQALRLPWRKPPALSILTALPKPDRHADLRAAILQNPDQPQAAFVKLCRVHPNTVRRARRELEEAGVIPYLAHRHAA